jgi:hypothetical protein
MQPALQEKIKEWKKFASLAEEKIVSGGEKYALSPDTEATDFLCQLMPGRTGVDNLLSDILRYTIRFVNQGREDDLFKIAAHAGMAWAKKFGSKERKPEGAKPKRRRAENKKPETRGTDTPAESSGDGNA